MFNFSASAPCANLYTAPESRLTPANRINTIKNLLLRFIAIALLAFEPFGKTSVILRSPIRWPWRFFLTEASSLTPQVYSFSA
jgi:hypothetical protein